jgi:hypothetical protein
MVVEGGAGNGSIWRRDSEDLELNHVVLLLLVDVLVRKVHRNLVDVEYHVC